MCGICGGIGFIRYDVPIGHPDFGRAVVCSCRMVDVANGVQGRIGTPLNEALFLEDVEERGNGSRDMREAAKVFIEAPHGFFTVYGEVQAAGESANGNGKTTCLQAVRNECVKGGVSALYITASDLADFLKQGIGDDDYDVEDRLAVLCSIQVLCLDETSQSSWSDWVEDKITTLLDRRYRNHKLGTVIAMDESPYQFFHRRLISRLETGIIVRNSDPDMRPAFKVVRR